LGFAATSTAGHPKTPNNQATKREDCPSSCNETTLPIPQDIGTQTSLSLVGDDIDGGAVPEKDEGGTKQLTYKIWSFERNPRSGEDATHQANAADKTNIGEVKKGPSSSNPPSSSLPTTHSPSKGMDEAEQRQTKDGGEESW